MLAREADYVAIDFETTGTVAELPAEPWQIGVVRLTAGRVTDDTFESLLRVERERPFNRNAPGRHHELREEIAAASSMGQLWPDLRAWCAGPLVAHNAATEKKHLREAAPIHRFGPWIDTLKLARIAYPKLESHKLDDLSERLELAPRIDELCPGRAAHDALYDAIASGLLLEHLLHLPGWEHATLEQLANAKPTAFYQERRKR